jgi:hypothetical protein
VVQIDNATKPSPRREKMMTFSSVRLEVLAPSAAGRAAAAPAAQHNLYSAPSMLAREVRVCALRCADCVRDS